MPSVLVPKVRSEAEALVVVRNAEAPRVGQVMLHDQLVLEGELVGVHDEVLGVDVTLLMRFTRRRQKLVRRHIGMCS